MNKKALHDVIEEAQGRLQMARNSIENGDLAKARIRLLQADAALQKSYSEHDKLARDSSLAATPEKP